MLKKIDRLKNSSATRRGVQHYEAFEFQIDI